MTTKRMAFGFLVACLMLSLIASGCFVRSSRHCSHSRRYSPLESALFLTAGIVSAAVAVADQERRPHDHHEGCGCPRRFHNGRWVYYFNGHWEYYDHRLRRWYFLEQ